MGLTVEQFVLKAIVTLRNEPYKGIHTVHSGFNGAFRKYFNADPVEATTKLAASGIIGLRPSKGGAMIYLPQDFQKADKVGAALKAMGL
jgi:hypothetical protein